MGDLEDLRRHVLSSVDWETVLRIESIDVKLRKTGVAVAKCVFHRERTPSLHFWESKRFYCHGCGQGGDILEFVALLHGDASLEFLERYVRQLPVPVSPGQLPLPL